MNNEEIVSAISGKPVEEVKEQMERKKEISECSLKLYKAIAKCSTDDKDLMTNICSQLSMLIHMFPIEVKYQILSSVALVELTGKSDEIKEQIKKFQK